MDDELSVLKKKEKVIEISTMADLQCRQLITRHQEASKRAADTIHATIAQLREEAIQVRDAKILGLRRKALAEMQEVQERLQRDLQVADSDYAASIERLNHEEELRITLNDNRLGSTIDHLSNKTAAFIQKAEESDLGDVTRTAEEFMKAFYDFVCDHEGA